MAVVTAVCPIDGCLPASNGTDSTLNVVKTTVDTVQNSSGVLASASGTTVIVAAGASFAVGQYIRIRTERMLITGISSNTLTVTRAQKGTTAIATITAADNVVPGYDSNGQAPHCPICGSVVVLADPVDVATKTGVATGSQHPIDFNATYGVGVADGNNTQQGTAYAGTVTVVPHGFAVTGGKVLRGTQVVDINTSSSQVTADAVTPLTINSTVGP